MVLTPHVESGFVLDLSRHQPALGLRHLRSRSRVPGSAIGDHRYRGLTTNAPLTFRSDRFFDAAINRFYLLFAGGGVGKLQHQPVSAISFGLRISARALVTSSDTVFSIMIEARLRIYRL